ncbi:MAG: DNA/RNA non-specific endonuclease [Tannerellaceae bacterium]|nr:DNA/RNA non-specific endonuclease [Tannerellaceae bacterium]
MAKKQTTTKRKKTSTSRRKKSPGKVSSIYSLMKQVGKWGLILFLCMIALLFVIEFYQKDHSGIFHRQKASEPEGIEMPRSTPDPTSKPTEPVKTPGTAAQPIKPAPQKQPAVFVMPEGAEIPRLMANRSEQVIEHEGYVVSYNSTYKIANWVAYELTDEEVNNKNTERTNKFVPDPMVKGATALNEDYTKTGFDRGHLAPAGDMRWSAKAMRESFYLSNICPQHPKLNRGIWKTLEEQVRKWALQYNEVYIATGPVIEEEMRVMGKNRVGVPDYFYKVVCVVVDNRPVGIGFLFENKDYRKTPLQSMVIPIDSVEKVTGIDFFYKLPEEIQHNMESKIEWEHWTF